MLSIDKIYIEISVERKYEKMNIEELGHYLVIDGHKLEISKNFLNAERRREIKITPSVSQYYMYITQARTEYMLTILQELEEKQKSEFNDSDFCLNVQKTEEAMKVIDKAAFYTAKKLFFQSFLEEESTPTTKDILV